MRRHYKKPITQSSARETPQWSPSSYTYVWVVTANPVSYTHLDVYKRQEQSIVREMATSLCGTNEGKRSCNVALGNVDFDLTVFVTLCSCWKGEIQDSRREIVSCGEDRSLQDVNYKIKAPDSPDWGLWTVSFLHTNERNMVTHTQICDLGYKTVSYTHLDVYKRQV